jgi:hypothetical protein
MKYKFKLTQAQPQRESAGTIFFSRITIVQNKQLRTNHERR